MKRLLLALLATPALAQVPPAELGQRNVPAPWWMREPVIAATGSVRAEVPANRAGFTASFSAVERSAAAATEAAAGKVRALDAALRAQGADRVRLQTSFRTRPLYDQYRDKDGRLIEDQRADKIERYEVTANLQVDVRDLAALERAYAAVLAARPTSVGQVNFSLEPGDELRTRLFAEAVRDAARRARLATEAAGTRLGAVKVIDPAGRVCQTDVLAGWPSYGAATPPADVTERVASFAPPPPPPPPPPAPAMAADAGEAAAAEAAVQRMQVTLQPPRQWLTSEACLIYGLLP